MVVEDGWLLFFGVIAAGCCCRYIGKARSCTFCWLESSKVTPRWVMRRKEVEVFVFDRYMRSLYRLTEVSQVRQFLNWPDSVEEPLRCVLSPDTS